MGFVSYVNSYLIAEPELDDPNFKQAVVILLLHDQKGALGLVLNKFTGLKLGDVFSEMTDGPAANLKIHWGGPVEKNALFIIQENESQEGYEWSPLMVNHVKYLKEEWPRIPTPQRPSIKVFMGYSGWGSGQLENELSLCSWKILPLSTSSVFYTKPSHIWSKLIERFGGVYTIAARTGFKPCLN